MCNLFCYNYIISRGTQRRQGSSFRGWTVHVVYGSQKVIGAIVTYNSEAEDYEQRTGTGWMKLVHPTQSRARGSEVVWLREQSRYCIYLTVQLVYRTVSSGWWCEALVTVLGSQTTIVVVLSVSQWLTNEQYKSELIMGHSQGPTVESCRNPGSCLCALYKTTWLWCRVGFKYPLK